MKKLKINGLSKNEERAKALGLKPAPTIKGYFFGKEKSEGIIKHNEVGGKPKYLGLYIETIEKCNLNCWFCYSHSRRAPERRIGIEEMKRAVDVAAEHGVESVIVAGKGEPLLDPNLMPLARHVSEKGLWFVLFTNNTLITPEIASELYGLNTSVIAKLGSLDAQKQDSIVGIKGAHKAIRQGLDALMEAGFNESRLAADVTITKENIGEMGEIWRYLRRRSIIPYLEPLIESGKALENEERLEKARISREELVILFLRLREIDEQEFGYTWAISESVRSPGAEGCSKNLTTLTLRQNGDVGACVNELDLSVGNVFEKDFEEIVEGPALKKIRLECAKCQCKNCGVRI